MCGVCVCVYVCVCVCVCVCVEGAGELLGGSLRYSAGKRWFVYRTQAVLAPRVLACTQACYFDGEKVYKI